MSLRFEEYAAEQLIHRQREMAERWRATIAPAGPEAGRPSAEDLLDTMRELLAPIAEYVRTGRPPSTGEDTPAGKALRHLAVMHERHGADPQTLVGHFDALARVLDAGAGEWLQMCASSPGPEAAMRVAARLNHAPILMAQAAVAAYADSEARNRLHAGRQMREFADTLVHELNTPLGAAEAAALVLEDDELASNSQKRRRFAGIIQRNLRRARMVIQDVRDMALAHTNPMTGGRLLPIGQVLGEVFAEAGELVREAGATVEVSEPIPDMMVDASRLQIILLNLLSNAAKYSDPARPVKWVRIGFEPTEAEDGWWISVADNGIGISPQDQERLFERFFRAHPSRGFGSGLGLSIVREAVRQLGGLIEFDSEPGVGSTFRVYLPATRGRNGGQAPSP